jgi:hypothetical protein
MFELDKLDSVKSQLLELSDEELAATTFAVPWQFETSSASSTDPDGFKSIAAGGTKTMTRGQLQAECWTKAIENPQINTNVRGTTGRMTGFGFSVTSPIHQIQEVIDDIELDFRNRLYTYYGKFVARAIIEGELMVSLTAHEDGFIEVDFIDPATVGGSDDDEDGVILHPTKPTMPLFYKINSGNGGILIPSIYIARAPAMEALAKQNKLYSETSIKESKTSSRKFKQFGGYRRFVVAWDRSFITTRNVSHLRTSIKWLNYYENLKEYEIDHKKSSGAYLWVVKITDPKIFRLWLSLTDEQRRKTGIGAKKVPGSTLVLPFGMEIEAKNPQLPKISDSDTDILDMVVSGLNESSGVTMGTSKSSYSSEKAGRGPMSDRLSDEIALFDTFLKYDFWGSIFFLRSKLDTKFPAKFPRKEVVDFKKTKKKEQNPITGEEEEKDEFKPVFKTVEYAPERLIEINYPSSEIVDVESRARAFLGVKHGSTYDVLGIPNAEIAKKLGFGNYHKLRLRHATEQEQYPELIQNVDQESFQEKTQAEPGAGKVKRGQDGGKSGKEDTSKPKSEGKKVEEKKTAKPAKGE